MSNIVEIERYYDETAGAYLRFYGNIIQAFRPRSEKRLLNYLASSIGLRAGQHILDAGCGFCGPAVHFAGKYKVKVDGITLSGEQVRIARESIAKRKQDRRVTITKGDYHRLTDYYPKGAYDGVVFLESLGHAADPRRAISEAVQVIRDGGFLYIKDFFIKESNDEAFQEKVNVVVGRINDHYRYNTLRLLPVVEALRQHNMEVQFIRRFKFSDDTKIRARFEQDQGIDIFEGYEEFWPAEWLELRFVKASV